MLLYGVANVVVGDETRKYNLPKVLLYINILFKSKIYFEKNKNKN